MPLGQNLIMPSEPSLSTFESSADPASLLSHLERSLQAIAPPRPLSVQVLQSVPRRTTSLFAHSLQHPKHSTIQDVLVLLYVHPLLVELPSQTTHKQNQQRTSASSSSTPDVSSPSSTPAGLLIAALEVQLFTSPSTSTTTIYIAKADSSGYSLPSTLPSRPYTKTLVASYLSFYLSRPTRPTKNVDVHLFARSQKQYLFPDSGDLENRRERKKVLGGGGLCRWWKGVFEEAVKMGKEGKEGEGRNEERELRLSFVIPGSSAAEADQTMGLSGEASIASSKPGWTYSLLHLPTAITPTSSSTSLPSISISTKPSLADLIPTFEDDPRTRFLAELSLPPTPNFPTAPKPKPRPSFTPKPTSSPSMKTPPDSSDSFHEPPRAIEASGSSSLRTLKQTHAQQSSHSSHEARQTATRLLSDHTEAEFWELLAGRQECMLGSTVGFFCVSDFAKGASGADQKEEIEEPREEGRARIPTLTFSPPSPQDVDHPDNVTEEEPLPSSSSFSRTSPSNTATMSATDLSTRSSSSSCLLPKALYTRLCSTLLNQAFATDYLVEVGSQLLNESIHTLLSSEQIKAAERRIEAVPVREEEMERLKRKAETVGGGTGEQTKGEVVTVNSLQPRKKKKKVD
jgi:regulator of Ty1 transposition protein 109